MPFQYDIRFEKGETKFATRRIRSQVDCIEKTTACALSTVPLTLLFEVSFVALTSPMTCSWSELNRHSEMINTAVNLLVSYYDLLFCVI